MEDKKLTAANGRPVADNQNVQTVAVRFSGIGSGLCAKLP